jgi:hypothetical protein
MTDAPGPIDLKALIEEAAAEAYNPRARRCWGFHHWTMWREIPHPSRPGIYKMQKRQCLHCGVTRFKQKWI